MSKRDKYIKMGKYSHFKNNEKYIAYAMAYDQNYKEYVIYQATYGKKLFWIRNKDDFFGTIEINGNKIKRFVLEKDINQEQQLAELVSIIEKDDILLTNEENGYLYKIVKIANGKVFVCQLNTGAYLSNVELAHRLGYTMYSVNDEIKIRHSNYAIEEQSSLKIIAPDIIDYSKFIVSQFNPCSIDLRISDNMFIKTKRFKNIDPTSLDNVNGGGEYWKNIRIKHNCIKLKPGQTILTNIYERIKIPNDCAGKIEIKSTYSRLSLSITEGDFCNPGYEGHFPLVIRNDGNNSVIIHPKEMMAQLILVKVSDSIISNYSQTATHINDKGYDEGTPYSFWYERSLKRFRKENGAEDFYQFYLAIEENINAENSDDINEVKERFKNTFLSYISKKIKNDKTTITATSLEKYALQYTKSEKIKKRIFNIKWPSGLFGFIAFLVPVILQIFPILTEEQKGEFTIFTTSPQFCFVLSALGIILLILSIFLFVKQPKSFCTFEKMDLGKIAKQIMKNKN